MRIIFFIAVLVILVWYLSFLATRLDRLHHRVETSWANLDGLLQRRAAIALEIAHSELADPAMAWLLTQTAHQAREAAMESRSDAESSLTSALGALIADDQELDTHHPLVIELEDLNKKITIAIALHTDAVHRTQMVRRKFIIRIFRLAGHAPLPITYAFEADAI